MPWKHINRQLSLNKIHIPSVHVHSQCVGCRSHSLSSDPAVEIVRFISGTRLLH